MVPLGKVVAGHGVRGLARVKPFNPGSPALSHCREAWLARPRDGHRELKRIRECRPHQSLFLVAFEGIDSLDALEPWIGSAVEVEAATLPEPGDSELYQYEALGLEVFTVDGRRVGTVVDVMALPGNDVWVVRPGEGPGEAAGPEVLIPVVGPIVTRIDLAARRALITPIPGLLDG